MIASSYAKVEGIGEASIFRGDPRIPETDMDKWFQKSLESGHEKIASRPYLYGSDAGFCARRNVLLEHNSWVDANVNAAGTAYMAIGVAFEDLLAKALRRQGLLIAQGVRLVEMPELKISGIIDLVVFDVDGELALVEVKTCGKLPTEIKAQHLAQIQTYAAVSGIHKAWVVYMSRELMPIKPLNIRTFPVECGQDALVERLRTAFYSRQAADRGVLPPIPATFRKHTECHYCEFRDYFCWGARPGKGGGEAISPLPEGEPGVLAGLDATSFAKAKRLYEDSPFRQLETVDKLLELEGVPKKLYRKLQIHREGLYITI